MRGTVKERIFEFVNYLGITKHKFEMEIGVSNGYFNQLRHCPGVEVQERIFIEYPELNPSWLLSGIGPMLKNGDTPQCGSVENTNEEYRHLKEKVSMLEDKVKMLENQLETKDEQIDKLIKLIAK